MSIKNENNLQLSSQEKETNVSLGVEEWVTRRVIDIIESDYLKSQNFVIGEKLLEDKLKSWSIGWIDLLLMEILISRPEFLKEKYWESDSNFLLNLQQKVKPQSDYYKKVLSEMEKQCQKDWILKIADNPAWFSLKTKDYSNWLNWLNYKSYLTIPVNWYTFISNIYKLWLMLEILAKESWDKISLKIPMSILWFLSHSDSLVIHYKNIENKENIERLLEEWKIKNWINEENRNLWRTKFAWDSSDDSFSWLVSKNIEKWIVENYWKYDNELIADLAMQYAIQQSQIPPKFN